MDRYGGWSIVIAYEDPTQPLRNLTIFDGLQSVVQGTPGVKIALSGFLTPPAGQVQTTLGVVAYEGDRGLTGDSLSLNTTTLSDAANPANNFFNSSISSGGVNVTTKNPNYANQLGFDALLVNANGVLAEQRDERRDHAADLERSVLPWGGHVRHESLCPERAGDASRSRTSLIRAARTIAATRSATRWAFTNSGQDGARDFLATDVIPAGATYVPTRCGSCRARVRPASPTDASGDDIAAFNAAENRVVFRLGQDATRHTRRIAGGIRSAGEQHLVQLRRHDQRRASGRDPDRQPGHGPVPLPEPCHAAASRRPPRRS